MSVFMTVLKDGIALALQKKFEKEHLRKNDCI